MTKSTLSKICCSAVAMGMLLVAAPAVAVNPTGNGVIIAAPASVAPGALEANSLIQGFEEVKGFQLAAPLSVDVLTSSAGAGGAYSSAVTVPGAISTTQLVDSYFFHFDPVGSTLSGATAQFTFDHDILGIIFSSSLLDASDPILGAGGTLYPTGTAGRGFDVLADSAIWVAGFPNQLNLTMLADLGIDQVRVITKAPEPSTYLLLGTTLLCAVMLKRRRVRA